MGAELGDWVRGMKVLRVVDGPDGPVGAADSRLEFRCANWHLFPFRQPLEEEK